MGGDPVADKSGFLCMYMSNHPDTLVSYVRYWGKVSAQVSTAKMTSIDTNVRQAPPLGARTRTHSGRGELTYYRAGRA